jgi:hypothetical protein
MEERDPKKYFLGFHCSVKTFNDTGFGLLVVSGKEVYVVFFEKRLKYSVDKFSSFVCKRIGRRPDLKMT